MQELNRNLNPCRLEICRTLRQLVGTVALIGLLPLSVFSQAPAPAASTPAGTPNRWLIIVDTSRGMESRAEAAQKIAGMLVVSGMNGQMRRGDTIGLWTFNQNLYAGQFPLQDCKPETSRVTAQRVAEFLGEQKNEKASRLEKVIPEVDRLVKASDHITVILITDGERKISGTPYDAQINAAFKNWRDQQKKAQMPFITVLRANHGQITDYVVNAPPWPLEMPPMPKELQPPPKAAPKPTGERVPIQPPTGNLIVSGKKPDPAPASAPPSAIIVVQAAAASNPPPPQITTAVPPQTPPPATTIASPVMMVMAKTNPAATNPPANTTVASSTTTPTASDTPPSPPAPSTETSPAAPDESPSASPAVSVQTASAIPTVFTTRNLGILGAVLGVSFLGLLLLRKRQPQTPSRISLITRSLDREH